jgi:hypothetical protein
LKGFTAGIAPAVVSEVSFPPVSEPSWYQYILRRGFIEDFLVEHVLG